MSFLKHMVHSSPGMADFLTCMEVIRSKKQPGRTLKLLTLEFLNDHMNSNQDPSKADLLSSLSKVRPTQFLIPQTYQFDLQLFSFSTLQLGLSDPEKYFM